MHVSKKTEIHRLRLVIILRDMKLNHKEGKINFCVLNAGCAEYEKHVTIIQSKTVKLYGNHF